MSVKERTEDKGMKSRASREGRGEVLWVEKKDLFE